MYNLFQQRFFQNIFQHVRWYLKRAFLAAAALCIQKVEQWVLQKGPNTTNSRQKL